MNDKIEIAGQYFSSGYNCAQSVLLAIAGEEIDQSNLLKISTAFGGGMAREQEVCGAVTGGLMALGLKYGINGPDQEPKKAETYDKSAVLIEKFKSEFGTILCREILDGCDLKTEEGRKYFSDQNFSQNRCTKCVKYAASVCMDL